VTSSVVDGSPLSLAALRLIAPVASGPELGRRFADHGAVLQEGVAEGLLAELSSLGLVRVARGEVRTYVLTSLGQQVVDRGLSEEASAILKDVERLRTDLLSTIAHELRTPLTVVRTSTGLLLDPISRPTDEQRTAMLETIERNAERMQRLIGDILDLARFRSGSIRLQLRRFEATDLASTVLAAVRPLADQRSQVLEIEAPPGAGPHVFGDRSRLERALLNLVSTALKFSPAAAQVIVRVRRAATGEVRWSVIDTGPGIAEADQARLFERFFVGGQDQHSAGEGVGLGLPTALAIAQAHGGTIEVDSRPGHGSTFTLVVPADGPAEPVDDPREHL
jgi:signal transduction histidine kinase